MTQIYDASAPYLGALSVLALFLLVVFICLGSTRKFWVVLLYVSWELFATAGLTLADYFLHGTAQETERATQSAANRIYADLYWTNDVVADLLRFVLVAVLIYKVVESAKAFLGRALSGLVAVVMVLPFVLYHPILQDPRPLLNSSSHWLNFFADLFRTYPSSKWFNSTSQLLSFGAAIMNVVLWGALIQSKKRDPQILIVSLGIGILVTGTAITYGLRHFVPQGAFTAIFNLFLNLTQLTTWLVWCRAFWPKLRRPDPA